MPPIRGEQHDKNQSMSGIQQIYHRRHAIEDIGTILHPCHRFSIRSQMMPKPPPTPTIKPSKGEGTASMRGRR